MQIEIEKETVVKATVTITVDRLELLHIEAALDQFTDMNTDAASAMLGMYSDEFDSELACSIHSRLVDARNEV